MADTSLVFNNLGKIDTIAIDATISEQHNSDVEITDHSVENGSDIADHARVKPLMLIMECCISETPIGSAQQKRIADSQGVTTIQNDPSLKDGFAAETYSKIEVLRDSLKIITVVTRLKTYRDLMIQSISVPVDVKTGTALRFSITFKQVRLVNNKYTTQTIANTNTTQGKKKKSLGDKPQTTVNENATGTTSAATQAKAPLKSIAAGGLDSLIGTVF